MEWIVDVVTDIFTGENVYFQSIFANQLKTLKNLLIFPVFCIILTISMCCLTGNC